MISVIDRYILRSLLTNYLIALGTMLSLYVALDLFVNMDEFTEKGYAIPIVLRNVASYYGPNLLLYFKELSSAITLFACVATLGRMRKLHELTAVLASGVSLYRIAAPVVGFGVATTALLVIDTELLIPAVAHRLARDHDDADGTRAYQVLFLRDGDDALLSAARFSPSTQDLSRLLVISRDEHGDMVSMLEADRARWQAPSPIHPRGRWKLERGRRTSQVRSTSAGLGPTGSKSVEFPAYYESDLSPETIQLRQSEGWLRFLSLAQLSELERVAGSNRGSIVQTEHARRTTPLVGLVMLLLGIPFFLQRSPEQMLTDAGRCMLVCGLCYVVAIVAQGIRPADASALPAWIPIFVFGTLAVVLIDRIRT